MKVKTIRYERRFNLGNYEHEVVELTADLDEADNVQESFRTLRETVIFLQSSSKVKKP